jgi:hypothetical protein
MKCKDCNASMIETTPENNEEDFSCLCGIKDKDRIEKKDGSLGCNLHYTVIHKVMDRDNEMATDEYLRSGY